MVGILVFGSITSALRVPSTSLKPLKKIAKRVFDTEKKAQDGDQEPMGFSIRFTPSHTCVL